MGKEGLDWHLEFTTAPEKANHSFDDDDMLVFYPNSQAEFDFIIQQIEQNNIPKIKVKNPYWDKNGVLIKDPDRHNIIISDLKVI